ncbi:MAG: tRNA (adenosine(37)-N6)-threonylcarbamoyltransferase complex transferase subunit TsaD [Candidatus Omnitrophota bacterium]|nr:tRNA (adenosine(37)-N6)-threonylcarbamoyltransferase complex transferase subunit TsaD [Candidatus Omnitrophota bacterium]
MLILGIETSCDETAASVVKNGKIILSQIVSSSLNLHKPYGGIIPEIASRKQVELILPVVKQAIKKAKIKLNDIDLISVTSHPGLKGSLLVGLTLARILAFALNKALIEVDHTKAHLFANFLSHTKPKFPFIGLVISGGHTNLYLVKSTLDFKLLGCTLDDAVGEAFDKVARILKLGYPGGPAIDKLAKKGNPTKIKFSAGKEKENFNFSFSGIKTAVLYYVRDKWDKKRVKLSDIASSFQEAAVKSLIHKSLLACDENKVKSLVIGGGVAANSRLREILLKESKQRKIKVYFPAPVLCLDNASMVAALGFELYRMKPELMEAIAT